MSGTTIQQELLKVVSGLSAPLQREVLDYARSLGEGRIRGTPGKQLLKFAGILSPEEAKAMMDAIEEGCEQVDPNEW